MKSIKALLIGFVLAMVTLTGCGSDSPSKVAQEILTIVYQGKGEKLINYVDLSGLGKSDKAVIDGKLQADIERTKKMAEKAGGVKSIEVIKEEVREEIVVVTLKVTFKDGTTKDDYVRLRKVDGKWKMFL